MFGFSGHISIFAESRLFRGITCGMDASLAYFPIAVSFDTGWKTMLDGS